jgi:carboxypeptidase C (cathepsin A)
MPTLAKQIVDSNTAGGNPILNFQGFAVGNPYTDVYSGTPAMVDTYWGHQIVSKPSYDKYVTECAKGTSTIGCLKAESSLLNSVGNLNPYALDYPVCLTQSKSKSGRAQRLWLLNYLRSAEEKKVLGVSSTEEYQPCEDNYANTYLNRDDVKQAIHVKTSIKWTECSNTISYSSADGRVSTAPIYNYLIEGGYKLNILVYSGDDDSVCGTIGTQSWIWDLGYEVSKNVNWKTYTVSGQTAGYLTQWKDTKLAFLTVHGAGHEVPTYKPEVAFDLFQKYINGDFTA